MPRYVALLRAVNVGGHVVKMDHLRALFARAGFANVETFIASGNVIFESPSKDSGVLERKIETALEKALGYEVATFLRTDADIAAAAAHRPFSASAMKRSVAFKIGFIKERLDAKSARGLESLATDHDAFSTHGREVYWLCRVRQSESQFNNYRFEKSLGIACTWRGANTVTKLALKYPPGDR
jgi:uncharacterized protein (DUF1697 family)